jgi:hypothetical protein
VPGVKGCPFQSVDGLVWVDRWLATERVMANITVLNDLWVLQVLTYSPQPSVNCRRKCRDSHGVGAMFLPWSMLKLSQFVWHMSRRWYFFVKSSYFLQNPSHSVTTGIMICHAHKLPCCYTVWWGAIIL